MKFLFRFFNEPDIALSLECCYLEEKIQGKDERNHQIAREVFSG